MSKLASYFLPTSLAWWAGIAAIVIGLLRLFEIYPDQASELGKVLTTLYGVDHGSPASLLILGLGLLGIRGKIEREMSVGRFDRTER